MEIKKKVREARFIFRLNKVCNLQCNIQSKIQLCKCLCIVLYSITFNSDSNYLLHNLKINSCSQNAFSMTDPLTAL